MVDMSHIGGLPLPSLRLLVPPLQLLTASLWRVVKQQDVTHYWKAADFVSLVVEMVPELLMYSHSTQLNLGLRARYILELCRNESLMDPKLVTSLLDQLKHPTLIQDDVKNFNLETVETMFLQLVHTLLKDPIKRKHFFLEVFPIHYGPHYDSDLKSLFGEFLSRLARLLPVPDLEQTASWLGTAPSVLDDCVHSVSEPMDLKKLLCHHKSLGHLDDHVPQSSMGDCILSSLSKYFPNTGTKPEEQPSGDIQLFPRQSLGHDPDVESLMDITAVEVVVVTEDTKVEIGASPERIEDFIIVEEPIHPEPMDVTPNPPESTSADDLCPEDTVDDVAFPPHEELASEDTVATTPSPAGMPGNADDTTAVIVLVVDSEDDAGAPEEEQRRIDLDVSATPESPAADVLLKVRSSGRKRKPTMKIQVTNLHKNIAKIRAPKRRSQMTSAALKQAPFNSEEHSYGTPMVTTQGDEEVDGSPATFACPKCNFCHAGDAHVQQHIDTAHANEPSPQSSPKALENKKTRFSCPDCKKTFKFESILKAHQRTHTGEQPYVCSQCGRRFSFKQSLERHRQTHTDNCNFECPICGELFQARSDRRAHQNTHMKNGDFLCTECGRGFAWKSALVRHMKIHSSGGDKSTQPHQCPHCEQRFRFVDYLNKHLRTHQERRYTCSCGKTFAYKAALTAHQRTHQKERPHQCTQCGKGFLYKGGLVSHMKIHSEEMPFKCSFCTKSFKRERSMKKHERCHTKEDMFKCSQCDKSFVYKATLVRHELTHSGERPYLCADCGKGFFSHAELLKHERFHTGHKPFECPHCQKRFTQSCYLTVHLRYHTGARPYPCNECGKSFLSANRLKRHQRTHTGEKPYMCTQCGKGFKQSYHLKGHQRTHDADVTQETRADVTHETQLPPILDYCES